jgi:hypothetical protein
MHRLLIPLGILLLAGSVAAGVVVFRDKWLAMGPEPQLPPDRRDMVPCIGLVDVENGVVELYPEQPGEVKWVAEPFDAAGKPRMFKEGEPLLELKSTMAKLQLEKADAAVKASQADLEKAQQLVKEVKAKREVQEATIAAAEDAHREADANRKAVEERYKTAAAREANKFFLEAAAKAVAVYGAKVEIEKKQLAILDALAPQLDVQRAEADLKAKQKDVKIAEEVLKAQTIKAPANGVILRLHTRVGEVLSPTSRTVAAIEFCPDAPKIVRAEIVQEYEDKVDIDKDVRIDDDSYLGKSWVGRIKSLSPWIAPKRMRIVEPGQVNDVRTRECIIEFKKDENQSPVRIGQRVRVKIKLK